MQSALLPARDAGLFTSRAAPRPLGRTAFRDRLRGLTRRLVFGCPNLPLGDHLLNDIGLSRADMEALSL